MTQFGLSDLTARKNTNTAAGVMEGSFRPGTKHRVRWGPLETCEFVIHEEQGPYIPLGPQGHSPRLATRVKR